MELWLLILCLLTTTDMAAFRSCCVGFNAILAVNAPTILSRLLESADIETVCALYGPLRSASSPAFYVRCLRRCQIAEVLAQAIGSHYVKKDPVVRKALTTNIKPYVLALGHFFEEYRSGLASYADSALYRGYNPKFADRLERQILRTYYNQETMQRICLTYKMINRILARRFSGSSEVYLCQRLESLCPVFSLPHDIYTFGGLELVTDIVTRVRSADSSVALHLAQMTTAPGKVDGVLALSQSVLGPPLSWSTTLRIHDLFPFAWARARFPLMDPTFSYPPPSTRDEESVLRRDFLNGLKSSRGKGPELMNRDVVVAGARLRVFRAAMVGDELVVYPEVDPSRPGERPYYRYWSQDGHEAEIAKWLSVD